MLFQDLLDQKKDDDMVQLIVKKTVVGRYNLRFTKPNEGYYFNSPAKELEDMLNLHENFVEGCFPFTEKDFLKMLSFSKVYLNL